VKYMKGSLCIVVLCEEQESLRMTQNIKRGKANVTDACYGQPQKSLSAGTYVRKSLRYGMYVQKSIQTIQNVY